MSHIVYPEDQGRIMPAPGGFLCYFSKRAKCVKLIDDKLDMDRGEV